MAITHEHEERYGLDLLIARCDDCNHPISCTRAQDRDILIRRIAAAQIDGIWREGMPMFCADSVACTERTWERYGRHLQTIIDRMATTLPLPTAAALTLAQARQARQDRAPADARRASWLARLRLQLRDLIVRACRQELLRGPDVTRQERCGEHDCDQLADGQCPYCQAPLCADDLSHHEWRHGMTGSCGDQLPATRRQARQERRA